MSGSLGLSAEQLQQVLNPGQGVATGFQALATGAPAVAADSVLQAKPLAEAKEATRFVLVFKVPVRSKYCFIILTGRWS